MNTLDYILSKYTLDLNVGSPIKIPTGRNSLSEWFRDLDFKIGVEIGVAEGLYSEIICKANPQALVYGVDPYESSVNPLHYIQDEEFDRNVDFQQAQERLGYFFNYFFVKECSVEALEKFSDNSLDFVYIDGDHTDPCVTQDIENWSTKVKAGGIVSGHDYIEGIDLKVETGKLLVSGCQCKCVLQDGLPRKWRVKEAVHTYTRKNNIKPWFLLDTGNDMKDDENPSWVWVKQ